MQSEPGSQLYHYLREADQERSRVHLRIDPDGTGTLIVNASRVMYLNPTATLMAYLSLEGRTHTEILNGLVSKYKVNRKTALSDIRAFDTQFTDLLRPDGACPIHELDLETLAPFSTRPTAPYRMDLAVTYRCNNDCAHCYNARERTHPELPTEKWKSILDKLWDLGVPHIVFTGGEPTLRADLPDLIRHAEGNGQITGINTNARRLADLAYARRLIDAGLDHVQITVESSNEQVHDQMTGRAGAFRQTIQGLKNALNTGLYVMTNTTMLRTNKDSLSETLDFLADLGVKTIGLNALIFSGAGSTVGTGLNETELQPILNAALEIISRHGQRLIWYTPTQYCQFDPTRSNLGVKGCTASLYSMCIESNGDVIPCQSYYQAIGNILRDPWDSIWNHELSVKLRERQALPEKCNGCPVVSECGGGCPLKFQSEEVMPLEVLP